MYDILDKSTAMCACIQDSMYVCNKVFVILFYSTAVCHSKYFYLSQPDQKALSTTRPMAEIGGEPLLPTRRKET